MTYILVSIAVLALVCLIGLGIGRYRRNQQLKNSGRDSLGMLAYCGTMYVVSTLCSVHPFFRSSVHLPIRARLISEGKEKYLHDEKIVIYNTIKYVQIEKIVLTII